MVLIDPPGHLGEIVWPVHAGAADPQDASRHAEEEAQLAASRVLADLERDLSYRRARLQARPCEDCGGKGWKPTHPHGEQKYECRTCHGQGWVPLTIPICPKCGAGSPAVTWNGTEDWGALPRPRDEWLCGNCGRKWKTNRQPGIPPQETPRCPKCQTGYPDITWIGADGPAGPDHWLCAGCKHEWSTPYPLPGGQS